MLTDRVHRVRIAHLPTPIDYLPRLSALLGGPRLYIKRDDQTGLATGGNKTRKLEFLIADALGHGADTVITGGAPQSNHCRQTAAAAARHGLRAVLVLKGEAPKPPHVGNILLDELLGAELRWSGDMPRDEALQAAFEAEQQSGHKPYLIPYGGSNEVGATGYVAAIEELQSQLRSGYLPICHFDAIVFASSSGGTQAGLSVGAKALGIQSRILGISVDKHADVLSELVADLANRTAERLGLNVRLSAGDIEVNDNYLGGGYAVVGAPEREAIRLVAQTEGLLLDPVYTGRAMAGLLDLIRKGEFSKGQHVLFWHTGGTAALSGFSEVL